MKIYNINGLRPVKDHFELARKQKSDTSGVKRDRLDLSQQALNFGMTQPLQAIVEEYLSKIPSIRKERVEDVARAVDQGYRLNRAQMEIIAERLLDNFEI
ncbi:hypothetical protein ACFL6I_27250 [candidate division KSB1 bacterium]